MRAGALIAWLQGEVVSSTQKRVSLDKAGGSTKEPFRGSRYGAAIARFIPPLSRDRREATPLEQVKILSRRPAGCFSPAPMADQPDRDVQRAREHGLANALA